MASQMIITHPEHIDQIQRMFHERSSQSDWSFEYVNCMYYGEWRWGVSYLLIIRDKADDTLWGTVVKVQVKDEYWCSIDDEKQITFKPVQSDTTITYTFAGD